MKSNTVLDYVLLQISPKQSRCDLFVSSSGQTEKLASGLIEQIASHLKVVEAQAAQEAQSSVKLEVDDRKHARAWFTKGTVERFVQFVRTPEALEMVDTFDAELSQLEAAKSLYSQGNGDGTETATSDDTKKELLRAIDLRLDVVKKDLTMALNHASASGFNPNTVSQLQKFAGQFDAHRLDKACTKFILVCQRRANLITSQTAHMSTEDPSEQSNTTPTQNQTNQLKHAMSKQSTPTQFETHQKHIENEKNQEENRDESLTESSTSQPSKQLGRQLSVQDRINLFECKQKENSNSGGKSVPVGKSIEVRRLSSDVSSAPAFADKSVLRRWSAVSDTSIDLGGDKKLDGNTDNPLCKPFSPPSGHSDLKDQNNRKGPSDTVSSTEADQHCLGGAANYNSFKSQFTSEKENEKMDGESDYRTGDVESTNQHKTQSTVSFPKSHTRSFSQQSEDDFGIMSKDVLCKEADGEQSGTGPVCTSLTKETGKVKTEQGLSEKQPSLTKIPRMKVRKPASAVAGSEDIQRSQGRKDDTVTKSPDNSALIPVPLDQAQRTRQSKGNQGHNDELEMKANELEKLFADHKLRLAADQSSSSQRRTRGDIQNEQTASKASHEQFTDKSTMLHSTRTSSDLPMFSTAQTRKILSNHDNGDGLQHNLSELDFSDDSRGKFYEKYVEKRDAKLRQEWSLKRVEKEAKLKAMQDAVEQGRIDMEAKFSCSSQRRDSPSSNHQRAEKIRSFNSRTSMKKGQHPISSFQSEEDDLPEYSGQRYHGKDRQSNGSFVGDGASRSSQTRKLHPYRNTSSTTPRATNSPIPRSSAKVSSMDSARRRGQSSRALAQSVPNFADLKKENTKPFSGVVKNASRSQVRNAVRRKNTNKEVPLVKKEMARRPQPLRKSSSWNLEFAELSTLNLEGELVSSELEKEQSDGEGAYDFDPDAGSDTSKLRATENMEHEEYEESEFEAEGLETAMKEEKQVALDEILSVEDVDVLDYEKQRLGGGNSRTENGDSVRPNSQDDLASVPDSPATIPSTFHVVASSFDSPGESPMAWSSRLHHPFSYPNETSDIDASADSPLGSPASWNSRMRKKWGSAQNPVITNASQFQARKEVTKGFKRFLRFGKKNRGPDSLMDWLSVTTSEGDDDTDDGRDLGTRSSEDLRKSRMGFMQAHPSDDGFNENELFTEHGQVPSSSSPAPPTNHKLKDDHISASSTKASRSFFSLSNFRSKGIDSNPR